MKTETRYCQRKGCGFETAVEGARYCAQDGSELRSEPYRSEFRKTLGVVGRDVRDRVYGLAQKVLPIACKASYPLIGQFHRCVQEKVQGMVGPENYDVEKATESALISKAIVSAAVVGAWGASINSDNPPFGFFAGALGGGLGSTVPEFLWLPWTKWPSGTIFGNLVSLPVTCAIGVGNYLASCRNRAGVIVEKGDE